MFAVQTNRTATGRSTRSCAGRRRALGDLLDLRGHGRPGRCDRPRRPSVDQVEVAARAQRDEHVVEGVVDRAPGRVHPDVGILRLLVGGGDARELGDLAPPGLGVEALAVAALALLQRGGDVHEEERAAGVGDVLAHLLAGRVERRDRAAHRDATVPRDLGGHPADPADVGLAVLLGEGETGRQVPAYDVAVEAGERPAAALEQPVHQRLRERGLAAAGEAGEEDDQALLARRGPVGADDVGHVGGRHPARGEVDDRVGPGVVGDHLGPQRRVGRGVAVRGKGYGDHVDRAAGGGRDLVGHPQRRAQQADGGEGRGAAPDEGQHGDVAPAAQLRDLGVADRVGHGDEGATGVTRAHLGRRQVEPAERAVLGVGQRRDGPPGIVAWWSSLSRPRDGRQRQPLGVDQLDRAARVDLRCELVREGQGDRAARLVEPGGGRHRPDREQLEVVELPRRRAVLGEGRARHTGYLAKPTKDTRRSRSGDASRAGCARHGGVVAGQVWCEPLHACLSLQSANYC